MYSKIFILLVLTNLINTAAASGYFNKIGLENRANESSQLDPYEFGESVSHKLVESNWSMLCMVKIVQHLYDKDGTYLHEEYFYREISNQRKKYECLRTLSFSNKKITNVFNDVVYYKNNGSSVKLYTIDRDDHGAKKEVCVGFEIFNRNKILPFNKSAKKYIK